LNQPVRPTPEPIDAFVTGWHYYFIFSRVVVIFVCVVMSLTEMSFLWGFIDPRLNINACI